MKRIIPGYLRVLLRLAAEVGCVEWDGKPGPVFDGASWNDLAYLDAVGAIDLEVRWKGRRRVGGRACIREWALGEMRDSLCVICRICRGVGYGAGRPEPGAAEASHVNPL